METTSNSGPEAAVLKKKPNTSAFSRVAKYSAVRIVTLFITVVIAIYLTIMIANMGGYVDKMMRSEIEENITMQVAANPANKKLTTDEKKALAQKMIALQIKRLHLDQPLAVRTASYLSNAITLRLGRALQMSSDSGSRSVRLILMERMPATLLLMGSSQFLLFFVSLFMALSLSRKYGSFWDKLIIALTPSSAAPGWFYGIFLILIFAALLKVLPFGGLVDSPPPTNTFDYILSLLKHLLMPGFALFFSGFFLSVYGWRTFFLIYSSEDYVEMAKAKGLSARDIERRYILRPTLPNIITNFALLLIGVWQGAIVTETIFSWPGLGRTLFQAIGFNDTPVIVASAIIYAYLLALTVFLLEFIYALVDPRVKIGGGSQS
jgi:peptide/nickel transport system permease protein